MKATDIRVCLINLKQVESHLAELSLKTTDIEKKKNYHKAMLTVSEVIEDVKDRLVKLER